MSLSLRRAWDGVSIYLPLILMGLLALGSWWLVRSTPMPAEAKPQSAARHEVDYYMRHFSVLTYDAQGRRKSEVRGERAEHYPDTDTIEITQVTLHAYSAQNGLTTATADRGLSNADGSEVQLFGNARVTRQSLDDKGQPTGVMNEFRSEFVHVFTNAERLKTHLPVTLIRGQDQFTADSMEYDNLTQQLRLHGHVRGQIQARR